MGCFAQVELARLHREAAQRAAAAAQHQRAAAAVAQASSQPAARPDVWGQAAATNWAAAPPAAGEELLRSLKVSWYLKVWLLKLHGRAAAAGNPRLPLRRQFT